MIWFYIRPSFQVCNGTLSWGRSESHRGNRAAQNINFPVYTLTIEIDLLEFNHKYPKNPKTFGEKIRKTRIDKGLEIKELAEIICVTEDTVINWEIRGRKPRGGSMDRLRGFIGNI